MPRANEVRCNSFAVALEGAQIILSPRNALFRLVRRFVATQRDVLRGCRRSQTFQIKNNCSKTIINFKKVIFNVMISKFSLDYLLMLISKILEWFGRFGFFFFAHLGAICCNGFYEFLGIIWIQVSHHNYTSYLNILHRLISGPIGH